MAKDLASEERSNESTQHADATLSTTTRPAPVLRYWHTTTETQPTLQNKSDPNTSSAIDNSVFQRPICSNAITTIELLKEEPAHVVELESSDEDEVVEVALPPKPTITIESSDEEAVSVIPIESSTQTKQPSPQTDSKKKKRQKNKRRADSASPVPSVVSSISDDFIRGDCVAFNISRRPLVEHFDLNLHGSDLLDQHSNNSLSQKTKKKKSKNKNKDKSSDPCAAPTAKKVPTPPPSEAALEQIFTTPQSKGKRKSSKNYAVSELSIPDPDIYETDSNQSAAVDGVVETAAAEGNHSKDSGKTQAVKTPVKVITKPEITQPTAVAAEPKIIDLSSQDQEVVVICKDPVPIEDNLIMGNVTGLEPAQSTPNLSEKRASLGKRPHSSPKGFPNRTITSQRSTRSREEQEIFENNYSSNENLREHMDRYYNKSWGGEKFDHVEIQKTMSRDKSLWAIDPRDRMPTSGQKRRCHYCNHTSHGYDRCRLKPRICHMCGDEGHYEPRCPKRMCLRCGAPNSIFSIHCRSCVHWNRTYCDVCQVMGHPIENCPDLWRRYHSTVENDGFLVKQTEFKRKDQIFCSGCARRGHLAHNCHQLPFSNLPIYTPIVFQYRPVYPPEFPTVSPAGRYFTMPDHGADHFRAQQRPQKYQTDSYDNYPQHKGPAWQDNQPAPVIQNIANPTEIQPQKESQKRPLTSSNNQEFNKKRSLSNTEVVDQGDLQVDKNNDNSISSATEKYEGVLQDNEVSNTSEVVTTANIYIAKNIMEELKKQEGCEWLSATSVQYRLQAKLEEQPTTFLRISGLPADQEGFQNELKQWVRKFVMKNFSTEETPSKNEVVTVDQDDFCKDIPQNKFKLLRMLNRGLAFLQSDLGDPNVIYKELLYLRNRHKKLSTIKTISPKKLNNNRNKINEILKNLNMILVGQAGLADGSRHVRELYSLQDILMKLKKHELTYELRNKVGEHYHFIFNSMARNDYVDLMNTFYNRPIVKPVNVKRNNQPKAVVKVGKKQTKLLKRFKGKKVKNQEQGNSVLQVNSENMAAPNQSQAGSKEYAIDQIQTFQKKLRKQTTGDDQRQQGKQVLLNRLRKFQVQAKRRGLFQKQYIQLDKLLAETKKFCGES